MKLILLVMKKIFLIVVALGLFSMSSFAQSEISVGYCSSDLYFHNIYRDYNDYRTPYGGFYLSFTSDVSNLGNWFTLRSGLAYSAGSSEIDGEIDRESYLTIPLDFRLRTPGSTHFYVSFGPHFSYGLSSTVTKGGRTEDVYETCDYKRYDVMLATNCGFVLSGGLCFQIGIEGGMVTRMVTDDARMSRNAVTLGIGYSF